MNDENGDVRAILPTLDPKARDDLRRVLISDQADRDADRFAAYALPRPERPGLSRHIDLLTLHPDARRRVVQLLGEIAARPDQ